METIDVTGIAGGGDGVGRLADGRAVFVPGAIPGDTVAVELTEVKARFARGAVVDVVVGGPGRVVAPCPVVDACGGCGWQHIEVPTQRELKARVVAESLTRIGRLTDLPEIDPGPDLPAFAYRTTVRGGVADERFAYHAHHSDELVPIADVGCLVGHPLVDDVVRRSRFEGHVTEVTVRAGAATGERLVVVSPRTYPDAVTVPDGVAVAGADELRNGHRAWIHEEVAGRRWRISAQSFFQARPDGAAALAEAVAAAVPGAPRRVVDLYGGVGLLGGVLAARSDGPVHLQVVEASASSVADARHNLADLADVRVVRADVRRWHPSKADVVLADPSRHGLGAQVVDRIVATGATTVVLVSCDAGALGRDAGLLHAAGLRLGSIALVDHFPHTPHVEVVTSWQAHPDG